VRKSEESGSGWVYSSVNRSTINSALAPARCASACARNATIQATGESTVRFVVNLQTLALAVVVFAVPTVLAAQSKPPAHFRVPDGERLEYSATWRLWRAGTASLALQPVDNDRQVSFHADSSGIASVLFPVHDQITSRYNPSSFCVVQVNKDTVEGRRKRRTSIEYEPSKNRLVLDEQNLDKLPAVTKHEIKPIAGCVLDLLSAVFYVRSLPLVLGEVYNFPVNEGGKTVEVQLVPDLKESVTTPAGAYETIRTEPKVFNKVLFQRSGRAWVWFSNDELHLPVMLKAKVAWGTITAVLTKVTEPPTAH
jgi:hypothetical protein